MNGENEQPRASLTDEQVIELGQMGKAFLENPLWGIFNQMVQAKTMQAIDNAPPDHTKEVMWQKQYRAVWRDFCEAASGMVLHAERKYAEMADKNSPQAQEQRRLDEQGFGLNFGEERAR